ncbi:hypothetical protein, partial [Seonamhaeicola marinus]
MRNRKESHSSIRQNAQAVKKPHKHDANLQKNSTLYFQVGLIVCLLMAYGLFEMKFETQIPNLASDFIVDDDTYSIEIPLITPVKPKFEEPVVNKAVKKKASVIKEVPDDTDIAKDILDLPDEPIEDKNPPVNPDDVVVVNIDEEVTLPFDFVEVVPIYPGCEKSKNNLERKKCMSEKINKRIQRKFNTDLGTDLGLNGKQVIQTQFKIDKTGRIIDVKTRGT